MDTISPPPAPSPMHRTSSRHRVLKRIAVITIILAGLVTIAEFGIAYHKGNSLTGAVLGNTQIVVSANSFPAQDAQVIKEGSLQPLTLEGQGTANVYDVVAGKKFTYVLLSGPEPDQVSLYRKGLTDETAGYQQLTESAGKKLELSVNELAQAAVFTAIHSAGENTIVAVDLNKDAPEAETELGTGEHPVLMADGVHIVYMRGGTILSVDRVTGNERELLTGVTSGVFAVNPFNSELAVYDQNTQSVQEYFIDNNTSVIAKTSQAVSIAPDALFYAGTQLLSARSSPDTVVITTSDGMNTENIQAPGFSLDNVHLTAL